jgi:hypothetical protein
MAQKIKTALPPHLDLGGSWRVEWDAVDPTTGASVAGVKISETSLHVEGSAAALAAVDNPILIAASQ